MTPAQELAQHVMDFWKLRDMGQGFPIFFMRWQLFDAPEMQEWLQNHPEQAQWKDRVLQVLKHNGHVRYHRDKRMWKRMWKWAGGKWERVQPRVALPVRMDMTGGPIGKRII